MKKRVVLVAAWTLGTLSALAATKSFVSVDGSWGVDANWSPSGVPVLGDTATIPKDRLCRVGADVTTALVKTTVDAGGSLIVEGGALTLSDNSTSKQSLTVNGRLRLASGSLVVHDLTIGSAGKAEFPAGTVTVHNNMYNNAPTTATTGLHIGTEVQLAKGYWNFNAPGGVIADVNRKLTEIRVPTAKNGEGSLLITNANLVIDTLGLAYHKSSRQNLSGTLSVVDSDLAIKNLAIKDSNITGNNIRTVQVGNNATLALNGSVGWEQGDTERFACTVGGEGVENAKLVVTNTSNQIKSITLGKNTKLDLATGGSASVSKIYVKAGGELAVSGGSLPAPIECQEGGVVTINGGTVEGLVSCAGAGRVVMNGGTLSSATLVSAAVDTTDEAYYCFDGGAVLNLTDIVVGGSSVNGHQTKETTITPTVMEFRDCTLNCFTTYCYLHVGAQSEKNTARVIFDGCKMSPSNGTNYKWYLRTSPNVMCDVVVKGTKNELYFQQLEGSAFKLEFVFDGGIAPIHLERTGHPESVGASGNLYLSLADGASLLPADSFDILTSINVMDLAQKDFVSTPWSRGPSIWSGALTPDKKAYRVTVSTSGACAPGSGTQMLAEPKDAGALSVPVGDLAGVESVDVVVTFADGSDRLYSFPAASVKPNATNTFAWDYAGAAQVTGVRVTEKHAPQKFYLHFR